MGSSRLVIPYCRRAAQGQTVVHGICWMLSLHLPRPRHNIDATYRDAGDEILAAKVVDSNTHFLCKELHAIGWRVSKVCCPVHSAYLVWSRVAEHALTYHPIVTGGHGAGRSGHHCVRGAAMLCQRASTEGRRLNCALPARNLPLVDVTESPAAQVRALSPAFELVITAGGLGPTPDDVTMAGIAASLGTTLKRDATLEVQLTPPYHVQLYLQHCTASCLGLSIRSVHYIVPHTKCPHDLLGTGTAAGLLRATHYAGTSEARGSPRR